MTNKDELLPDEIYYKEVRHDKEGNPFTIFYAHPCDQSDGNGYTKYIRADLATGGDRGKFHDAFWRAYKTLDENIRKRFSLHTGRQFANNIFDEYATPKPDNAAVDKSLAPALRRHKEMHDLYPTRIEKALDWLNREEMRMQTMMEYISTQIEHINHPYKDIFATIRAALTGVTGRETDGNN